MARWQNFKRWYGEWVDGPGPDLAEPEASPDPRSAQEPADGELPEPEPIEAAVRDGDSNGVPLDAVAEVSPQAGPGEVTTGDADPDHLAPDADPDGEPDAGREWVPPEPAIAHSHRLESDPAGLAVPLAGALVVVAGFVIFRILRGRRSRRR